MTTSGSSGNEKNSGLHGAILTMIGGIIVAIIGGVFALAASDDSNGSGGTSGSSASSSVAGPEGTPSPSNPPSDEPPEETSTTGPSGGDGSTTQDPNVAATERFLLDMEPVDGFLTNESNSIDGVLYPNSISTPVDRPCGSGADPRIIEYQLGRKWRTFHATIGLGDKSSSDVTVRFEVHVDDSLKKGYTLAVNQHKDVTIDVSGRGRLKLRMIHASGPDLCGSEDAVWGNAKLTN